ncbi:MAG: DsbA family protein [Sulfitobacter sp.]
MKPQLDTLAVQFLTSQFRRKSLHMLAETRRFLSGSPRELHYFHQVSDPYSHLMVQVLPALVQRFGLVLRPHVIGQVDPEMMPEPEMLKSLGPKDAADLARLYDLNFPSGAQHSSAEAANAAGAQLAKVATVAPDQFCADAFKVSSAYWRGDAQQTGNTTPDWALPAEQKLAQLGHYLPGTVFYAGEWYWGVDRLDHLEARLIKDGLGDGPAIYDKTWNGVFDPVPNIDGSVLPPLELFFSARSPYSYISLFQARRFADANGLVLKLRPVLPMVMRNMKVPYRKRLYIVTDAKREATKTGLPFGKIADPLGIGIERTYAIAYWLHQTQPDMLEAFFRSALSGIVTEALDVATDSGLGKIVDRAGLDWSQARLTLEDTGWQEWVQSNRDRMSKLGFWGVPCLRFGDVSAWGQDRFWVIRQNLLRRGGTAERS